MEDFRQKINGINSCLFSGACTLSDMNQQSRQVLYGHSDSYPGMSSLGYAILGAGLIGLAGKFLIDAQEEKGLSVPMRLILAGGSAVAGVGLMGYSLANIISE